MCKVVAVAGGVLLYLLLLDLFVRVGLGEEEGFRNKQRDEEEDQETAGGKSKALPSP